MHTEADQKKHYAHKKSAIYFASSIRTNILICNYVNKQIL